MRWYFVQAYIFWLFNKNKGVKWAIQALAEHDCYKKDDEGLCTLELGLTNFLVGRVSSYPWCKTCYLPIVPEFREEIHAGCDARTTSNPVPRNIKRHYKYR